MVRPDYSCGNIVNLMSSLSAGLGRPASGIYPPLALLPPEEIAAANNVVLLVVDGMGYDFLCTCGGGGPLHAHLRGRLSSVFPPTTASALTSILTGTAPQQHGVTGWFMYLREIGAVTAFLPFRPRCGGPSLDHNGLSPAQFIGERSWFSTLGVASYLLNRADLVDSPYAKAVAGGATRVGYRDLFDCMASIRRITGEGTRRKYICAYWPELDALAHAHGIASKPVAVHLRQLEQAFADLITSLRGSDTLLLVTADHGLVDTQPQHALRLEAHPTLLHALALPLCGEPRAAYCYLRPGHTEAFERYLADHLSDCCRVYRSEDLIHQGWFGNGPPAARLGERVGDYVLVPRADYVIKDQVPGERPWTQIGVHGGTSSAELYVPLLVART